jgi:hypothetical protein
VARPEGKRPLGTPRRREDNIKIEFRETRLSGVDRINLAQDGDQWEP